MGKLRYYCILAVAGVAGLAGLCVYFWPRERLDPPEVLEDRVLNGASLDEKVSAARDLVRHGRHARVVVGRVLAEYEGDEPQVMVPLLQATGKARAWQSLPRLLALMEHPDVRIRGKAGAAARTIMGADYYFRANDPPEKRAEALARMKAIYQEMKPELQQFYSPERR